MQIKKAYVDTREGQIHYRHTSGSDHLTPLVMIHQTTSSSVMFEAIMMRLSQHYHMIAPDFPGYGNSFVPENVPDIGYYSDAIIEGLNTMGIIDFHLFGHHTGGGIALDMAVRFPDRVKSLSIVGPVYISEEERVDLRAITTELVDQLTPKADGSHLLAGWKMLEIYGAHASVELHHREALIHLKAWKGCRQAFNAIVNQDFAGMFDRVSGPLLILCSPDDVLWPYFVKAREARPDAESVIIKGRDYECDLDPDGVANAVHLFLQKHP